MVGKRNNKTNSNRPILTLQIGHTLVRAILFRHEQGRVVEFQSLEETWQSGNLKISSTEGAIGLKDAFRRLLQKLPRNVEATYITLSGEFCVTRVVSDTNENVLHEIREIESRSNLYLSLGHGPKVVAGNIIQQDPRHQHATVSVVHRQTIEAILEISKSVGLSVISIEPSVISLCRLMGAMEVDREAPVLLMCPGQTGVEIAISYQGRLYLDYRPAGVAKQEDVVDALVHHLERLQRYCRRHARVMQASIASVYLSGDQQRLGPIYEQLASKLTMPVRVLKVASSSDAPSLMPDNLPQPYYPAAGVGLLAIREHATPGPNLLERLHADADDPIVPRILRLFTPLAAVLLVAAMVWSYLLEQRWELDQRVAEAAQFEPVHREALEIQGKLTRGRELLNVQKQISDQIPRPPMGAWLRQLGRDVPEDTWLTSMALDSRGDMTVEGASLAEASVFDYVQRIRQLPFVTRASVEGVIPTTTPSGPGVKFTIYCDFDDQEALQDQEDGSI
ncbi:hypothetical protein DTL21_23815 [Bremerella cremea]|uniref:Uncharacterized protein n=1 Tax=Blastopirellula marina TaxID=124 RepID=A0A2S8FDZ3_9BACT|nr:MULTISPECIES: PilN domain-containing protein [Pirellulaceae]PQO30388.1 hypothetical protein C5Y83_23775 [Blastopirellula marina]RCS43740.1 hypothetical protein DTL21_23815 [Bremerella cremea]